MIVAEVGEAIKMAIIIVIKAIDPKWGYQSDNRYIDRSNYRRKTFNHDYGQRNRNKSVRQTDVRTYQLVLSWRLITKIPRNGKCVCAIETFQKGDTRLGEYDSGRGRSHQNGNNYGNQRYRPRNGGYQSNNRYNDRSNYRRKTLTKIMAKEIEIKV